MILNTWPSRNWTGIWDGFFFVELRNSDGEQYKKTTLTTYRHAIQRHIASCRNDVDIIHGSEFKNSKTLFKAQTRQLKAEGKAKIDHYPPVEAADMAKLYNYVCADYNSADLLQKKVNLIYNCYFQHILSSLHM